MRLVAVFIDDSEDISKRRTINFGGNFIYDVQFVEGMTILKREKNENFIENFFDETGTITNISAIVGRNGSGKTSNIFDLINVINQNFHSGISFWEEGENCYLHNLNINPPNITLSGDWNKDFNNKEYFFKTIYYSPYLDYKREAYGIDISSDRYLKEDLNNINTTYDAGSEIYISERLKRANIKRFIQFQKSEYSNVISKEFGLFNDNMYRVIFTRHKINVHLTDGKEDRLIFENTPQDFQSFLDYLYSKIRNEYDSFNRYVNNEKERYLLNIKQFKNQLLMDLFCLLIRLLEFDNNYLYEGHFKDRVELENLIKNNATAEELFRYWLENYEYSKGEKEPLPDKEVLAILDFLYNYLDNLKYSSNGNYLNWSSKSIFFHEDDLNKLLDLNEALLLEMNKYYFKDNIEDFTSLSSIQQFVNVEFANRNLSSGETGLLNLYSKIYDYFSRYVLNLEIIMDNYYLLFLDEADLGFHPSWKRKFIDTLILFSKNFFQAIGAKVQIIFTTHDPLTLSDIPDSNVIFLDKQEDNSIIRSSKELSQHLKTFGSNINDLLADSFFIDEGLIGSFAMSRIQDVIDYINKPEKREEISWIQTELTAKKVIEQIGEKYLADKLNDMFLEEFPKYKQDEILRLKKKIEKLENDSNR